MQPVTLFARDLPDMWFQCLYSIFDYGKVYTIDRGSFKGQKRLEFDYITVHIKNPGTKPLLPEIPEGLNIPNPVADDYLDNYLPYLMEDIVAPNEIYTYGQYLKPQIPKVIEMLKKDGPNTNQACMSVGDKESIVQDDPACLRLIDCRISNDKLHFMVYFRSNELWAGAPANLAAIQLLKEYMANEIGVEDGEMVYASKGLHLYDYSWNLAKIRTGRFETCLE